MSKLIPYLNFEGQCEEAMNFYKECVEGSIGEYSRFSDSPQQAPEEYKNKIMHVEFRFDDNTIMAADVMPGYKLKKGNNMNLNLAMEDPEKMAKWFNNLAVGGIVLMDLQDTFWGARFGMVEDKYGVVWMFNHDLK